MYNAETVDREPVDQQAMQEYERLTPAPATHEDVAALAVFLAPEEARAITGQTYSADSGRLAHKACDSVRFALTQAGA